jgi:15-cis-phytoene synthase
MDAFAHCETLVRAADRDRFLAALFAPAEQRGALFALYAFNVEVARVREAAREPMAGEIRLQWWHDLLGGTAGGEAAANPVAAALSATIARYRLPLEPLAALLEARRFDLYDEPMATLAELEAYGASTNLIAPAARILADGREPDIAALARHAGLAYAIGGLLKAFPAHAARGQLFVPLELLARHGANRTDVAGGRATPSLRAALADLRRHVRDHLAQARTLLPAAPTAVLPALLPVALVPALLACMERRDYDPFVPVEIAPWRRQWLIWRAARRPARLFE